MNVTSYLSGSTARAERALIFYSATGHSGSQGTFATIHDVDSRKKGHPELQAGRMASKAELCSVMAALMPERRMQFIDQRVLAYSENSVIWWVPPSSQTMHFRSEEPLGERSGVAMQPGLVFARSARGWAVFAVKGKSRPKLTAKLYQAPYMNVYSSGSICEGNVEVPAPGVGQDRLEALVKAFFGSSFTHPNVSDQRELTKYPAGIMGLWKDMLDGAMQRFPNESLVKHQTSLEDLIQKFQ